MPYIEEKDRKMYEKNVTELIELINNPGELNYVITKLTQGYIKYHKKNYKMINEAIGVLECAKLELYRRIAAPYENTKIASNGDVLDV